MDITCAPSNKKGSKGQGVPSNGLVQVNGGRMRVGDQEGARAPGHFVTLT